MNLTPKKKNMRSLSLSSALFSAFALQLSAQSEPETPKAPVTIEPGLEKAVEWKWWVVPSDSVKNWANPTPQPAEQVPGTPGANGATTTGATEPRPREYEVKKGDVLTHIGRRYGITAQQLKEFNGFTKDTIHIGQVIKIPTMEEVMAMAPPPEPKKETRKKQEEESSQPQTPKAPAMLPPGQEDLLMQIYLDREGFSCGSVDGNAGPTFTKILQLYRDNHPEFIDMTSLKEKALEVVGHPLTAYTLKPEDFRFIAKPAPSLNTTPVRRKGSNKAAAAKEEVEPATTYEELTSAPMLLYRNAWEFVAERYHCDELFLRGLNPRVKTLEPGTGLQVPNVIPFEIEKAFEGTLQPVADPENPVTVALVELTRLEVSRGGKVIAVAPVGFARPGLRGAGSWTIHQAVPLPKLATLQELKEAPKPSATVLIQTGDANPTAPPPTPSVVAPTVSRAALASEQFIAEGPNNPVGLVWLNLSKTKTKEALPYGLHGTSIPRRIKSQEGIGGIRLTNWDLMRIVRLIPADTQMQWK
ncbi:LysM domain-containing protein [Roseimicrobium gellanilyticum]|uniref:LysM domain-containing protein n=1 Tax=Roseimicrobium gellanilyticum TaxID=748857 RepID=A0A366H797_9BACT|nr:LysM peptidoglycan-binding domain-containing protein [Roseimicrobium gellanilyticum]RBP38030.1 LysM domain-containing protein [Roseimicrobium gellanilyticum]